MEVVPAIDLRGGKCVRLFQGDYGRETVYSEDPVEMARHWVSRGASRLHVVDLDAARTGSPANIEIIERVVSTVDVPVQSGGGVRTLDAARRLVSAGVQRVLVGTSAVERPDEVREMCTELGQDAVVVSIDARDGYVAVKGWTESTRSTAVELLEQMTGLGVVRFLYTDITRDGTLTEPNFHAIESLAAETGAALMVAGGISTVSHLLRLAETRVESAIVGTALYTGDIDLRQAVTALAEDAS
jgi:phosphoribosylformimino-5-aminoimidazole carboxamide ribotide isomerase